MMKPKKVRKASQHAAMAMKGEGGAALRAEKKSRKKKPRKSPNYNALIREFGSKHGGVYSKDI